MIQKPSQRISPGESAPQQPNEWFAMRLVFARSRRGTMDNGRIGPLVKPTFPRRSLIGYLANLSPGRLVLWCYLIWYLVVLIRYFDPSPFLWATSFGLSLIIGFALYLSTAAGPRGVKLDGWQTFRLFLMPFCVSSFAALVKGRNFILIFSPNPLEVVVALMVCGIFCSAVFFLKRRRLVKPGSECS